MKIKFLKLIPYKKPPPWLGANAPATGHEMPCGQVEWPTMINCGYLKKIAPDGCRGPSVRSRLAKK